MPAQAVTLRLPLNLYDHFKRRADEAHRSLEAELLDAVAQAAPTVEELPPEITESLTQLPAFDDEALWRLARESFAPEAAAELEALHWKRQSEGLTPGEKMRAAYLVRQHDRSMVLRAQAIRILKERGQDVAPLLKKT